MKQAAVMLGVIGGILGLILGVSVSGWLALTGWLGTEVQGDLPRALRSPENADLLKAAGVLAPLLAIAGGAMAVLRPYWAAGLLLASAAAMYGAFGLGFFTTFPIAMCALAGLLALLGGLGREPGGLTRR
ncbi:hypothetical protein HMH01_16085 [Halovulum dunhuangense]|uniref:Uncharacterized protein n=1 Tax=Halovulum dunhuangense TaxID=1505036 RepID=A0A849L7B7_9RHOB|nr:hypothetical protein [Halovulum dunhuangense]NNU81957.1 hypothetical protein [Halovulum dunhuangense]